MNSLYQQKYAAPKSVVTVTRLKPDLDTYPFFKVIMTFTLAPAVVGLVITLILMFSSNPILAFIGPIVVIFAEILYGLQALIAGIIISACRWQKNGADILKATAVGGLCAGLPALASSPIEALSVTLIAAVTCMLLAYLVLPADEYWDIPVYESEESDYWAVEIPPHVDETTAHNSGVYYLSNLPRPSSQSSDAPS